MQTLKEQLRHTSPPVRRLVLLEHEEPREAPQVRVAQPGAHEDALRTIDPLVDRRAQLVQLGEPVARRRTE